MRKNSAAASGNGSTTSVGSAGGGATRGRASTLSHIDVSALDLLSGYKRESPNPDQLNTLFTDQFNVVNHFKAPQHPGLQRRVTADSRGHSRASTMSHVPHLGLDTSWRHSLPTVPSQTAINHMYDFAGTPVGGPTINPQQLHLDDSIDSLDSPFVEDFEWMGGFNSHAVNGFSEHGLAAASPSGLGGHSPMFAAQTENTSSNAGYYLQPYNVGWQQHSQSMLTPETALMTPDIATHMRSDYGLQPEMGMSHLPQNNIEGYYPTPPPFTSLSPDMSHGTFSPHFAQTMGYPPDHSAQAFATTNACVFDSSQFQQTPIAVTSITEVTRQALLQSLSQPSSSWQRRSSQTVPFSNSSRDSSASSAPALPSLEDIQRYVGAYIHFFQPHSPFLHIPTLNFDSPAYTNNLRVANVHTGGPGGIIGGGGCLILAMAAIGALYELEPAASKDLFDAARKMIQLYLEERRKADLAAAISSARHNDSTAQNTPLWLVQAMLLNVIYGHQCGDKVSGYIASTHCAALVSLGRAAGLLSLVVEPNTQMSNGHLLNPLSSPDPERVRMHDTIAFNDPWGFSTANVEDETAWRHWVAAEERKRTLYAIFNMSSLLVSAYNHAPAIMNSEIHLDLPCEEELWTAETAGIWTARGGVQSSHTTVAFASALSRLLMSSQNQTHLQTKRNGVSSSGMLMADLPQSELRPSTFGCLVLINALHNFIWETRQRHSGVQWTTQESEGMIVHMEAALRAWSAAWSLNPTHSAERPNPFQMGPLSADSIPLLDLAYVRLYVNLGLSKEHAWARDFEQMAEELSRGNDIIQHADFSHSQSSHSSENGGSPKTSLIAGTDGYDIKKALNAHADTERQKASRRERQLRKAAFYAADSLLFSSKLGVTFMDLTAGELPVQSAMCTFDCAQVLAEWITTVQERLGCHVGMIGRDAIDFIQQLPAHIVLEDEDCKLLEKTRDILASAEAKMTAEMGSLEPGAAMTIMNALPSCSQRGYGAQILAITSFMLRRTSIWPSMFSCILTHLEY